MKTITLKRSIEFINGEQRPGCDLAHAHDDLNPLFLHMDEATFSLVAGQTGSSKVFLLMFLLLENETSNPCVFSQYVLLLHINVFGVTKWA